jgi:hypothetical protein
MKLFADIHDFIKEHTVPSGLFSFTNITLGSMGFSKIILGLLSVIPITVGTIVGLITIYTWLEKKGLLPKWLRIPDKKEKE